MTGSVQKKQSQSHRRTKSSTYQKFAEVLPDENACKWHGKAVSFAPKKTSVRKSVRKGGKLIQPLTL